MCACYHILGHRGEKFDPIKARKKAGTCTVLTRQIHGDDALNTV